MSPRCTVCENPTIRRMIDDSLEEGVSGAGISRHLEGVGCDVSAEIINRHKLHYRPEPERPVGTRKRDFAVMVRDKAADLLENGELYLTDKDKVPGINAGLKAQSVIDRREVVAKKQTKADVLIALLAALRGESIPAQIGPGVIIEGEAIEIDGPTD